MRRKPHGFDEGTVTSTLSASPVRGLVAAWLFGSAASGRLHAESDVDVGVLLDPAVQRSVLVHEYLELDLDRAVDALDRLEPIERFVRIVRDLEAGSD